jgi:hypothetical protein
MTGSWLSLAAMHFIAGIDDSDIVRHIGQWTQTGDANGHVSVHHETQAQNRVWPLALLCFMIHRSPPSWSLADVVDQGASQSPSSPALHT